MTHDTDNLSDVGPATPPPAWCEPGAAGEWQQLVEGDMVCTWGRDLGDVWISCDDRIENGRVLRSAPAIHYSEEPGLGGGIDAVAARRLAAKLLNAADLLDGHTG
jgi:hypothetical protein